jgi:hypothetical protein
VQHLHGTYEASSGPVSRSQRFDDIQFRLHVQEQVECAGFRGLFNTLRFSCGNRFDQCLTRLGGLPNYDYIWWNATDWEGGLKYAPALQETAQKVRPFFYERLPAQKAGLKLSAQDSVMWRYTGGAHCMLGRQKAFVDPSHGREAIECDNYLGGCQKFEGERSWVR